MCGSRIWILCRIHACGGFEVHRKENQSADRVRAVRDCFDKCACLLSFLPWDVQLRLFEYFRYAEVLTKDAAKIKANIRMVLEVRVITVTLLSFFSQFIVMLKIVFCFHRDWGNCKVWKIFQRTEGERCFSTFAHMRLMFVSNNVNCVYQVQRNVVF